MGKQFGGISTTDSYRICLKSHLLKGVAGDAKRRVVHGVLPDWPWAKQHNPLRREIITPLRKSYRVPRNFCVSLALRTSLLAAFPSVSTQGPAAYNAMSHHVDVLATLPSIYIFSLPVPFIEAILSAERIDIPNTSNSVVVDGLG